MPAERSRPPGRTLAALAGVALALTLLGWVAGSLVSRTTAGLDTPLSAFAVEHRTDLLNEVMKAVTSLGSGLVAAAVAAATLGLLSLRDARRAALAVCVAIAGDLTIERSVKFLVNRGRPTGHELVSAGGSAFPSGHAMYAAAFFGILVALLLQERGSPQLTRIGVLMLATVVVLVGVSRVYLGVHWPTDVLGAWLLGAAWAWAVAVLLLPLPHQAADGGRQEAARARRSP